MKRSLTNLFLLLLSVALFSCGTGRPASLGKQAPVPSQRQAVGNLRAEQLKALIDRKADMVLIDTRTEYEFKQGRIPGAVNIPPHKFSSLSEILPRDKGLHLVFYCRGSA